MPTIKEIIEEARQHFGTKFTDKEATRSRLDLEFQLNHPGEYVAFVDIDTTEKTERKVLATASTLGELDESMKCKYGENWSQNLRCEGLNVRFFAPVTIPPGTPAR